MARHIVFFLIGMTSLLFSCKNEDCPQEVAWGDLFVQESSKAYLQDFQNKTFVFTDFLGNELALTSQVMTNSQTKVQVASLDPCEGLYLWGAKYPEAYMDAELYSVVLADSQGEMVIRYDLTTQPLFGSEINQDSILFDVLKVITRLEKGGEPLELATGIVDNRGNESLSQFSLRDVQDTVIQGREYKNLIQFSSNKGMIYTKDFGLRRMSYNRSTWDLARVR